MLREETSLLLLLFLFLFFFLLLLIFLEGGFSGDSPKPSSDASGVQYKGVFAPLRHSSARAGGGVVSFLVLSGFATASQVGHGGHSSVRFLAAATSSMQLQPHDWFRHAATAT